MTEQQAQIAIKTGNKGPGGCTGKDACDTFCNNPDNQETCFNFAKDNGIISTEQLQQMQEGQQRMKDSFSQIPQEVLDCLTSSLGADVVEKMKTGSVIQRNAGDSINQCFQKSSIQERTPNQNQNGQDQQNQPNQQIQPWADMCKPDESGNPTALACVDGSGKFVASAKVGSDGKPVCPADSTAKCGNYMQNNQQGQPGQNQQGQNRPQQNQFGQPGQSGGAGGPNQGQGFNPGSGQNGNGPGFGKNNPFGQNQPGSGVINPGNQQLPQQAGPGGCKGPEECQKFCTSNPEECKNFQPQQNQQGQPGGAGGPNQGQGFNPGSGQNGNGPGFGKNNPSGQPGQPGQFNQQGQPGQIQPQQQLQPQFQPQPPTQQQSPPPPPSSFLQQAQKLLGNVFDVFSK
jgi:hypothetical protein